MFVIYWKSRNLGRNYRVDVFYHFLDMFLQYIHSLEFFVKIVT
jgi:hypothetical protein